MTLDHTQIEAVVGFATTGAVAAWKAWQSQRVKPSESATPNTRLIPAPVGEFELLKQKMANVEAIAQDTHQQMREQQSLLTKILLKLGGFEP